VGTNVGAIVGACVGAATGASVVGAAEGEALGAADVGDALGLVGAVVVHSNTVRTCVMYAVLFRTTFAPSGSGKSPCREHTPVLGR
jgi:hypothetical protein